MILDELFDALCRERNLSQTPCMPQVILVAGVPRCGTSMTNRDLLRCLQIPRDTLLYMCESHALEFINIPALHEELTDSALHFIGGAESPQGGVFLELARYESLSNHRKDFLVQAYFRLASVVWGNTVVEKTPGHSMYMLQVLDSIDNAKVVFCVRHPEGALQSLRNRRQKVLDKGGKVKGTWLDMSDEQFGHLYCMYYGAYYDSHKKYGNGRVMILRYEDYVSDANNVREHLFEFAGLDKKNMARADVFDTIVDIEADQLLLSEPQDRKERHSLTARQWPQNIHHVSSVLGYE